MCTYYTIDARENLVSMIIPVTLVYNNNFVKMAESMDVSSANVTRLQTVVE